MTLEYHGFTAQHDATRSAETVVQPATQTSPKMGPDKFALARLPFSPFSLYPLASPQRGAVKQCLVFHAAMQDSPRPAEANDSAGPP